MAGQNANPNVERTSEDMAVVARSDADALLAELDKPSAPPNPLADVLESAFREGWTMAVASLGGTVYNADIDGAWLASDTREALA